MTSLFFVIGAIVVLFIWYGIETIIECNTRIKELKAMQDVIRRVAEERGIRIDERRYR